MTKIIQSSGFISKILGNVIGNVDTKPLIDLVFPLVKDVLTILPTKSIWYILNKFERNISEPGAVRAG